MESLTETALVGATEMSLLVSSDAPDSSVSVCVSESEQRRAEELLFVWSNKLVVISDVCFTTGTFVFKGLSLKLSCSYMIAASHQGTIVFIHFTHLQQSGRCFTPVWSYLLNSIISD